MNAGSISRKILLGIFVTTLPSAAVLAADTGSKQELSVKEHVMKWMLNDKKFVEKAAAGNRAEVELGQLALQKSQNPEVVNFAKNMVQDHTSASSQLSSIAQSQNLTVPTTLDKDHQETIDKLKDLSGAQFDAAYVDQMKKDHEKNVSLFTAAADDGKLNPQLRQFAQQTLPTLKAHEQHVKTLATERSSAAK